MGYDDEQEHMTPEEIITKLIKQESKKALDKEREKYEKFLKKKYSTFKGKDIEVTVSCSVCTQRFVIKGKNNKTDATSKQLCPHIFLNSWEVLHE